MTAPAAALIDVYIAADRADSTGLEISRVTNEPDYPALALIRAAEGEEVVVKVGPLGVSAYRGLGEYLRRKREAAGGDIHTLDMVVTGHGMRPFRGP
jgi:hypothetical protein